MTENAPNLYRIDGKEPLDYKRIKLSAADFAFSIHEFILENFRGAIKVLADGMPYGSVYISPEGAAYFIKLLLIEVYGEHTLRATVSCSQTAIDVIISCYDKPLNTDYMIKVAEKSGFSLVKDEGGDIILRAQVIPEKFPVFYANTQLSFKDVLHRMFFL